MIFNDNNIGGFFYWSDSSDSVNIGWFGVLTILVLACVLWLVFYEGTKSNYKITCYSLNGQITMEDHIKDTHVRSRNGNFYYHINGHEKEVSGNCSVIEE